MGFSSTEARKLQYEWSPFATNYKVNGLAVFNKLFTKYPKYQQLFKAYAPKDWELLVNNVRLMCHAQYVMKNIGQFVENAGSEQKLNAELHRLGGEHVSRKVTAEHFRSIFPLVIDQLVIANGGRLERSLWTRFFDYCAAEMAAGLKTPLPAPPAPSDEAVRDVFVDWDTDHSGSLDADELFVVMQNLAEDLPEHKIREMIHNADVDHDGKIQFEEFLQVFRNTRMLEESTVLSPSELQILKYEWKELASNYKVNGMVVFTTLFRRFPEYQRLFGAYAPKAWEELSGNVRLLCHSQYVLKNVGEAIDHASNRAALENHLKRLGGEHVQRKVGPGMFRNIFSIIVDQLVVCNGGKLHRQLWTHFFDYCCALMSAGLRQPVEAGPTPHTDAIREVFKQWDTDRDGALDADELFEVMTNLTPDMAPNKIKEMVHAADTNNDGKIQFDEFLAIFRH